MPRKIQQSRAWKRREEERKKKDERRAVLQRIYERHWAMVGFHLIQEAFTFDAFMRRLRDRYRPVVVKLGLYRLIENPRLVLGHTHRD